MYLQNKTKQKQRFHGNRNHVTQEVEERPGKEQLVRSLRKGGYRACVKLLELFEELSKLGLTWRAGRKDQRKYSWKEGGNKVKVERKKIQVKKFLNR